MSSNLKDILFNDEETVIKDVCFGPKNLGFKDAKERFIKEHGKLYCEVCGFDFTEKYGELGKSFIEAHHLKPVSELKEGEKTNINDLVMVCSNCHSMIHRHKEKLSRENLKSILKE